MIVIKNVEYLLRYVSMNTYNKIIKNKNDYVLELLGDNFIDVDLNIRYLIKYGVKNIDNYIFNNIEDLIMKHNDFIDKISDYESNLSKEEVIALIENM